MGSGRPDSFYILKPKYNTHIENNIHHNIYLAQMLSHIWLFATPWTLAHQGLLSIEFSRQEYWSGLPFPSPRDLPGLGIKPRSTALQAYSLPSELLGKPIFFPKSEVKLRNNEVISKGLSLKSPSETIWWSLCLYLRPCYAHPIAFRWRVILFWTTFREGNSIYIYWC